MNADGSYRTGELDLRERSNRRSIGLHVVIFIFNGSAVVLGMILGFVVPAWLLGIFSIITWKLVWCLSRTLNFGPRILESHPQFNQFERRKNEKWFYVNG